MQVDPQHRGWRFHLQHIVIYCQIHYWRGIDAKFIGHDAWKLMMKSLVDCPTADEARGLLEHFRNISETRKWAEHKLRSYVLSGLNKHCSQIDHTIWEQIKKNTNVVEASHAKSNQRGRWQSLLAAILQ